MFFSCRHSLRTIIIDPYHGDALFLPVSCLPLIFMRTLTSHSSRHTDRGTDAHEIGLYAGTSAPRKAHAFWDAVLVVSSVLPAFLYHQQHTHNTMTTPASPDLLGLPAEIQEKIFKLVVTISDAPIDLPTFQSNKITVFSVTAINKSINNAFSSLAFEKNTFKIVGRVIQPFETPPAGACTYNAKRTMENSVPLTPFQRSKAFDLRTLPKARTAIVLPSINMRKRIKHLEFVLPVDADEEKPKEAGDDPYEWDNTNWLYPVRVHREFGFTGLKTLKITMDATKINSVDVVLHLERWLQQLVAQIDFGGAKVELSSILSGECKVRQRMPHDNNRDISC